MSETTSAMQCRTGTELPELRVPMTRTFIVAGAIASRDYQDVHHDPALALERGAPDIFLNILSTNGLVGRFVTDWAGAEARLQGVDLRLGAPSYPGDDLVLTGTVTARKAELVTVAVQGNNRLGLHVSATVTLTLPREHA
jgi:hypothetical protein